MHDSEVTLLYAATSALTLAKTLGQTDRQTYQTGYEFPRFGRGVI